MRYPDWPERLNIYVVKVQKEEFQLGEFDCALFAAGCIEAITGEDVMPEYRDTYNSWESSEEACLDIHHTASLYKVLLKKFGSPLPGVRGRVGDLAFYDGCCGIVFGRYALFLSEGGYAHIRITHVQRIFRID